jgi:hypothetical protein
MIDKDGSHLQGLWTDDEFVMVAAKGLSHPPGVGKLVILHLVESDGERFHGPIEELGHQGHHDARVYPSTQQGAKRNLAHKPLSNSIPEEGQDLLRRLILGYGKLRGEIQFPVALNLNCSTFIYQKMSRRELADAPIDGHGSGNRQIG